MEEKKYQLIQDETGQEWLVVVKRNYSAAADAKPLKFSHFLKLDQSNEDQLISGDIKALAHALIEEHSSNGGNWASPDTELMIRGICDFDESPLDALKRLIGVNTKQKEG